MTDLISRAQVMELIESLKTKRNSNCNRFYDHLHIEHCGCIFCNIKTEISQLPSHSLHAGKHEQARGRRTGRNEALNKLSSSDVPTRAFIITQHHIDECSWCASVTAEMEKHLKEVTQ